MRVHRKELIYYGENTNDLEVSSFDRYSVKKFFFLTLIGFLSFENQNGFGQQRIDTVYYDKEYVELNTGDLEKAFAYELRPINKKGKVHGKVYRFNRLKQVVGSSEYKRGKPHGEYQMFDPVNGITIKGQYAQGLKSGWWVGFRQDESVAFVDEYAGGVIKIHEDWEVGKLRLEVNEPPRFDGGPRGWADFLRANLKYPTMAKNKKIEGRVQLKCIVMKNGLVVAPRVISSPDPSLSTEALRIMKRSPKWIPAKLNKEAISQEMQIQIVFRLG